MNADLFSKLIYESESSSLDFKREPHKFVAASDGEKAELLKDIISMVNARRTETAYIVLGVEELEKDRPHQLVGISNSFDDASLQEFVNTKLNAPCTFAYSVFSYQNLSFGIIEIPVQDRPVFLKKSFGGLLADAVYIRRGSSTAVAKPDEIAKMSGNGGDSDEYYGRISMSALKIVRERGFLWEYRLLSQLFMDEIKERKNDKLDYKFGMFLDGEVVSGDAIVDWFPAQMSRLRKIINPIEPLIGYIDEAVGPLGHPGDVDKIIYVAKSIGKVYGAAIEWAIQTNHTAIDEVFDEAKTAYSLYAFSIIDSFEEFAEEFKDKIERVVQLHKIGKKAEVSLSWVVPWDDDDAIDKTTKIYEMALKAFMNKRQKGH